jgi:hypothetical protein
MLVKRCGVADALKAVTSQSLATLRELTLAQRLAHSQPELPLLAHGSLRMECETWDLTSRASAIWSSEKEASATHAVALLPKTA